MIQGAGDSGPLSGVGQRHDGVGVWGLVGATRVFPKEIPLQSISELLNRFDLLLGLPLRRPNPCKR